MVTIELEEFEQMKQTIERLSAPNAEGDLSIAELQEATGILLLRAIENPRLFMGGPGDIQLGKYKAIFAWEASTTGMKPSVKVKLVRI